MLNDSFNRFSKVYLVCGYTDLRKGIDGLATIINSQLRMDPFEKDVLFLFCGHSSRRFKGLLWEGDGFLLLYKRVESGTLSWPRNSTEVMALSEEQLRSLLGGFSIIAKNPIRNVEPTSLF